MREVIFSEPRMWTTRHIKSLFVSVDGGAYELSGTARIIHVRSNNQQTVEVVYEKELEDLGCRKCEFLVLHSGDLVPPLYHAIASFPSFSDDEITQHLYFRYVDN